MKICKIFTIDAAHFLPNHGGKCKNLHGHTYRIEIELEGQISNETGMIVDFGDLKEKVSPLLNRLDHKLLNDVISLPTAEYMCHYLLAHLEKTGIPAKVSRVRVWETPTSYAEVTQ